MKKIQDPSRLASFIKTHDLDTYMDTNLSDISTLYCFDKDEHLIQAGTISDYLYFLVEGTVMVYSFSSDTQNICIDYAKPPTPLGEASSLWSVLPESNVKAVSACICVCISLHQHRTTLQQDVRFLQNICQLLSFRLNANINLANSLTEPVETRLAKFILTHQKDGLFSFQLTTCAAILNVSYRHLLRTINSFKENQILMKQRNGYSIQNFQLLEDLSENLSHTK